EYDTDAGKTKLDELLPELPVTPIVITGSDKMHIYFRDPGGLHKCVRDGLELRAGSHLCVLPPSPHPDTGRRYSWFFEPWEVELAQLPAQVLAYFHAPDRLRTAEPTSTMIPTGRRHDELLSLAGSMRRRGMNADEIAAALESVNAN